MTRYFLSIKLGLGAELNEIFTCNGSSSRLNTLKHELISGSKKRARSTSKGDSFSILSQLLTSTVRLVLLRPHGAALQSLGSLVLALASVQRAQVLQRRRHCRRIHLGRLVPAAVVIKGNTEAEMKLRKLLKLRQKWWLGQRAAEKNDGSNPSDNFFTFLLPP